MYSRVDDPPMGGQRKERGQMDRKVWDRVVSGAGALMAFLLVAVGIAAVYGGMFGQGNVRDRLQPQNISFAPADAMTPEESAEVGDFAGQKVENGAQAEAFSRYIGLHLSEVNGGKTYSETSSEAVSYTHLRAHETDSYL